MINNQSGSPQDFTVVVNTGDIGFTNGGAGTWRINRVWFVKSSSAAPGLASMQLFYTKRDWIGWPVDEDEVESGFNYAQGALIQKDYGADRGNVINLSDPPDMQSFIGNAYDTEIFGKYTIGISSNLTNGIQQFNRFSIVNSGDVILPVSLTNLKAYQKGANIQVDWDAFNEFNMNHYTVEKSSNGSNFISLESAPAKNNGLSVNKYSVLDTKPLQGNNFYRIKAIDNDGRVIYSMIVNVNISGGKTSIAVMPNPVYNSRINVQFNNLPAGRYNCMLYDALGQPVLQTVIEHAGGNASQTLTLPSNIANGIYVLKVFNKSLSFDTRIIVQ